MNKKYKQLSYDADTLNRARCVNDIHDFDGHPRQAMLADLYKQHENDEGHFLVAYGRNSKPYIKFHEGEDDELPDEEIKEIIESLPTMEQLKKEKSKLIGKVWD